MISFDVHTTEFRLKPISLAAKEDVAEVAIAVEHERITEALNVNDDPAKPLAHRYAYEKKQRGGKPIRDLTLTGDMLRSRVVESVEGNSIRIAFADDREAEKARKNDSIEQMTGLSPRNQQEVAKEFRKGLSVTDANDILDALVTAMATVDEFALFMTADGALDANIYAYEGIFPAESDLNRTLAEMKLPGCMVTWMGTAPGDVEKMEMWRHRYRAHVRLGADASNQSTYPAVLKALLDGIPTSSTVKFLQSFIHPNCLPMELPSAARKFGTNGLEYMAIDIVLAEIGDN